MRERERLVLAADRVSDILAIVELAERFALRAVVVGGAQAWQVACLQVRRPTLSTRASSSSSLPPLGSVPEAFD